VIKKYTEKMADFTGEKKWPDIANILENKVVSKKAFTRTSISRQALPTI